MKKSRIKSIKVCTLSNPTTWTVGETYNGMILDNIREQSIEYPDSLTVIYRGFTHDVNLVFEAINAPVEVTYSVFE